MQEEEKVGVEYREVHKIIMKLLLETEIGALRTSRMLNLLQKPTKLSLIDVLRNSLRWFFPTYIQSRIKMLIPVMQLSVGQGEELCIKSIQQVADMAFRRKKSKCIGCGYQIIQ